MNEKELIEQAREIVKDLKTDVNYQKFNQKINKMIEEDINPLDKIDLKPKINYPVKDGFKYNPTTNLYEEVNEEINDVEKIVSCDIKRHKCDIKRHKELLSKEIEETKKMFSLLSKPITENKTVPFGGLSVSDDTILENLFIKISKIEEQNNKILNALESLNKIVEKLN